MTDVRSPPQEKHSGVSDLKARLLRHIRSKRDEPADLLERQASPSSAHRFGIRRRQGSVDEHDLGANRPRPPSDEEMQRRTLQLDRLCRDYVTCFSCDPPCLHRSVTAMNTHREKFHSLPPQSPLMIECPTCERLLFSRSYVRHSCYDSPPSSKASE
eukprot:Gregarina_sp_Pseudo_9__1805@NODE_2227_length_1086_cov_141_167144_g2051_i0_p1_GENE_NODE_2227_length_1086_cov_141_167144_g2051_i0NODE_2227_length_1086_cov_141_167144_g2051_i0_p1_ORF_typecomplete_len157_score2_29_NODE_2227_length_1086_cov_141_167144_g2051_i0158628